MSNTNESASEVPVNLIKRQKIEKSDEPAEKNHSSFNSFDGYDLTEVLNENSKQKFLFLHGTRENKDAVILLEKTPFPNDEKSIQAILSSKTSLKETLRNDIYGTYEAALPTSLSGAKATIIYPATEKHIAKYKEQEVFVVQEMAEVYKRVTFPYIESQTFSLQWVYNILDKKCESDRIVYEDPCPENGFILLPDMKWDRKDINSLYLQCIIHRHGIKSLRDLNQSHLPLLNNILTKGQESIMEKFSVPQNKLRVFIHYLPSYYHLHVHFTHIKLDAPGFEADRAHLLLDVIENIKMCSDYYGKKSLIYKVRENDELYKLLQKDSG